ncbi:MAG: aminotransferase class I/II-fold pyridoxal phosphate-dependent enzyme, partial [Chloroflexi bacterium]|nr:aminotransferase class I/II-fold pyridoxal phosphate-dependent enzyme [Chloroflexota bacterium]
MDRTLIRANLNENPFNPIREFEREIIKTFKEIEINRYPDPEYKELRKALADRLNVDIDNIAIGNGSDELILYILLAFHRKGFPLVITHPTFGMYEKAGKLLGMKILKFNLKEDWGLPKKDIEEAVKNGAVIFLGYPNNPTANCWPEKDIIDVIDKNPG